MPNLKNNKKEPSLFMKILGDKSLIIFLAIISVLAINQIVFSFLLIDRERAAAFSSGFATNLFTVFGDQIITAGTNNVVLAEFIVPEAVGWGNAACGYSLAGNPCITIVDADGAGSPGPGVNDDPANYIWELDPNGNLLNTIFTPGDGVCANSLDPALVNCVYIDLTDGTACTDGATADSYIIGAGCALATDVDVSTSSSGPHTWVHSELVNNNGAYDYYSGPPGPGIGEPLTETIFIFSLQVDTVLSQGSYWNNAYTGQWQGDTPGAWIGLGNPGGEGYIDLEPTGDPLTGDCIFTGEEWISGTGEPVIIDLDGDMIYADSPDTLLDADGSGSTGIGADDDAIPAGTVLNALNLADGVCINTLGLGGVGQIILYVDGNGDCIPGNGGIDTLIRDDTATGLPGIIAGFGTFPFTFVPATNGFYYYDADSNGAWTWGAGANLTESLWVELQAANKFNANVITFVEADGTGSLGMGVDDDNLARGYNLSYLQSSDNICFSLSPFLSPEDIYVDGNGDCIPGNGGIDIILQDNSGDGLLIGSTFDGQWASAAGIFAYADHLAPFGAYTWGANSATTESLWLAIMFSGIYTASADTNLYGYGDGLPLSGDPLNDLSNQWACGVGPNGYPLIYADADLSGFLNNTDTILENSGNIQFGPFPPNGVIDRLGDSIDSLTIFNNGSAIPGIDFVNLKVKVDAWWFGGDGRCDASDPDMVSSFTTDSFGNLIAANIDANYNNFVRACLVADIPATAKDKRTIQLGVHQLFDANANGQYDNGDLGLFVFSNNSGPTDANLLMPDIFTVANASGHGGTVVPVQPEEDVSDPELPKPSPIISLPSGVGVGDLIKTSEAKAVYLVTAEGKRRPFPNETVWFSYYTDFNNLKIVSDSLISQIPLGKNVTLRAGTYLMKLPSDPKVYAVEPRTVLRWIPSETIAVSLYGSNWSQRVIDMSEAFFTDYIVREDVEADNHPNGSLIKDTGKEDIYYIEEGKKKLVSPAVFKANLFRDEFVIKNVSLADFAYQTGEPLLEFIDFFMAIAKNKIF